MLESKIQSKLIKELESQGWYVVKIIACNKNGFPDLACFKGKEYRLIEVKAVNGKLSPIQVYRHAEMAKLEMNVEIFKPK